VEKEKDMKEFLEDNYISILEYMQKLADLYYGHDSELTSLCHRVMIPAFDVVLKRKSCAEHTKYVCNDYLV
jgi:hypothetical protein